MHSSVARRALASLVPPKIATPASVSGGSASSLQPLVEFYSKLPKGSASAATAGIKGRYFSGKNASGKPLLFLVFGLFGFGYTLDYNMHLKHHKNRAH
ncbi:hypothetical protein SISNIDRAFT_454306 [Sistotremastrum niveocremeum HHB9708]|uniref:Uncharacterized protein n=2 Tax=Sistotremastraceae TaxID=3402574 RepID=A0A164V6H3_9AGAM|nr:hypothetical protein SISNIDRAFT_454306 [Sistotremastrum niveocremeum HHB9708]KZT36427.1 hypothetical protein SISSUDRAFT_1049844 [Sistotremastrum suecicum HHB10207 ss-3]